MHYDLNKITVYGHGFLGYGEFKPSLNNKPTKIYKTWQEILRRCYDKKLHERYSTYKDCTVTSEWHNFQVFGKWYNDNYYEVNNEQMNLDKDILFKGNKIYSPNTCIFTPKRINTLFTKRNNKRGKLPIGISFDKRDNKYRAECNNGLNKSIKIGRFNTPEEAFNAYKIYKENIIKKIAEEYKAYIPNKLYEALINYQVEIID